MKIKAAMMWSGGKDSSLGLYKILQENSLEVCYLVSTFSKITRRLSMHGVREELIEKQAEEIGIPLIKMYSDEATHEAYELAMENQLGKLAKEGIYTMVFGDIYLEDLRKYRESKLALVGVKAIFPLWQLDTKLLIQEFIALGFKTICCCIDLSKLDYSSLGQIIDEKWLSELTELVDPCGENGEFHTFCVDGPIFKKPLHVDCELVVSKECRNEKAVYQYAFVDIQLQ